MIKVKEILLKNLALPEKYKNKSVIDMVNEQETLIEQFASLGNTRDQFFELSRKLANIGLPAASLTPLSSRKD